MNHESESRTYLMDVTAFCPKRLMQTKHTITLEKSSCTRVPDSLVHFSCELNSQCRDCMENYD